MPKKAKPKKKPATKKSRAKKKKAAPKRKLAAEKKVKNKVSARKKTTAAASKRSSTPLPKQLTSPSYSGKPKKLARDTFPEKGAAKDFRCFGPAATQDGELEDVRICDLGCFTQDGKDSNKYYHGAVVQHRSSKNWYAYFEWGRTGGSSCSFQFVACQSEADARAVFAKQLHTKNDKRGEWVTVAGIRTLRAKKGKDCYLVRPMAKRTTGLPGARKIKVARGGRTQDVTTCTADPPTSKLLRDLQLATIAYTRKSMADSSLPTQPAITEARQILGEAQLQLLDTGPEIEDQIADKKLKRLTELMFSRIPRKKKVGAPAATWMLSADNIQEWQDDLDAFESALRAIDIELHPNMDLLTDMKLDMNWLDPKSKVGSFLHKWMPNASIKNHNKIQQMQVVNAWSIDRHNSTEAFAKKQAKLLKNKVNMTDGPLHQPKKRVDVATSQQSLFKKSNTAILFHGTRSVNVNAILRESLRLPHTLVAVALTGAKFGPGIYFSDDWKKAADYTNAIGSSEAGRKGAVRGRHAFMFISDVMLGKPYLAPTLKGYTKPPRGYHSVFAKAGHSDVDDNEFIVYSDDRFRFRYLIEFKTS